MLTPTVSNVASGKNVDKTVNHEEVPLFDRVSGDNAFTSQPHNYYGGHHSHYVPTGGPSAKVATPTQELSHTMKTSLNLNDGLIRPSGSGLQLPKKPALASFDLNLDDG